jgi:hypothetical protein
VAEHVDIDDADTKRLIRSFNALVHKHKVCPAQTLPSIDRRAKMAALQEEATLTLDIADVTLFMKNTVWPFVRAGGDITLIGFHYFDDFVPDDVEHADVEAAVFPEGYGWEDNDPKHEQNREVIACGHWVACTLPLTLAHTLAADHGERYPPPHTHTL